MTNKKIDKLTPEQEALLPGFIAEYRARILKLDRIDRPAVTKLIQRFTTEVLDLKDPPVVLFGESPVDILRMIKMAGDAKNKTAFTKALKSTDRKGLAYDFISPDLWGFQEMYWVAWVRFAQKIGVEFDKKLLAQLDLFEAISVNVDWWYVFDNYVFVSEKPISLSFDNQNRLSSADKAAAEYSDGLKVYSYKGVSMPAWAYEDRPSLTPAKILKETNIEVRRSLQEIYGFDRFFKDMLSSDKVKVLNKQTDITGLPVTLYAYNDGDITQHFVHVFNGTVEPDGTRHEFTITCKNIGNDAFESVFGTYPDLYEQLKGFPNRLEIMRKAIRT